MRPISWTSITLFRLPRLGILVLGLCLMPLVAGLSCSRCQKSTPAPLSVVPQTATSATLLSPSGAMAPALAGLFQFAQQADQKGGQIEEIKAALGFDPTSVKGLQQAGIDPRRDAALTSIGAERCLVFILPVLDAEKLEQTVRNLAQRQWRADRISEPKIAGHRALRFARSFGDREVPLGALVIDAKKQLAYFAYGGQAISAATKAADSTTAVLEQILQTSADSSLLKSTRYLSAVAQVRRGPLTFWGRGEEAARVANKLGGLSGGLQDIVLSAGVEQGALWLESFASLSEQVQQQADATFSLSAMAPPMLQLADADALLVAAGSADSGKLLAQYDQNKDLAALVQSAGVDLDRRVLQGFSGGIAASIYLGPVDKVGRDIRNLRRLPRVLGGITLVHVVADLKPEAVTTMEGVLQQYFAERGLTVEPQQASSGAFHTAVLSAQGGTRREFHYAVLDKKLLFGIGERDRFAQLLQRSATQSSGTLEPKLSAAVRDELVGKPGGSLYFSFATLATKLAELSKSPQLGDAATQSAVLKASQMVSQLASLSLHVTREKQGVRLRARVEKAPGKTAQ